MQKNRNTILWITRTGILLALLIVFQLVSSMFGSTLITGSLVNMVLVVAVMGSGLASGIAVALVSPFIAKLLGIGPLWSLVPCIALGNCTLVLLWHWFGGPLFPEMLYSKLIALFVAAAGKFLVLYVTIVWFMVPIVLRLPEKQAAPISALFSFPQLFTALIGGALALLVLPVLKKALTTRNGE